MKREAPSHWQQRSHGRHSAVFENDEGVTVKVSPRYRSSAHAKRGKAEQPRSYRVQLQQDWFSLGVTGDHQTAARAETFDEALETAHQFMREYNRNRHGYDDERAETFDEVAGVDGDSVVATEVTAQTVMDVVGYSDDYLVETLETAFGDGLREVVHREDETYTPVYAREDLDDRLEENILTVVGQPPLDKSAVESTFEAGEFRCLVKVFDQLRVFRFVVDTATETIVTVDPANAAALSQVEDTVFELVEQKWKGKD